MTQRRGLGVLCVDDNQPFLSSLVRMVKTVSNVHVASACSADDARQQLEQEDFAVLITDYRMPGESGIDLLEFLANNKVTTVPILTTAFVELEVALDAINRGRAFAFLKKPVQNDDVILTVNRAIERYKLGQELRDKIAELKRMNRLLVESQNQIAQLSEVAATDCKTGVRSYNFFKDRLAEEIARAERYQQPLTLVLMDLDRFKAVNDTRGHVVGDVVLRQVALVLSANIRKIDILARFGGDEFALLLPSTPIAGAGVVTGRLVERLAREPLDPVEAGEVTLSAGVAALVHGKMSGEDLIKSADQALYRAKRAGGNQLAVEQA